MKLYIVMISMSSICLRNAAIKLTSKLEYFLIVLSSLSIYLLPAYKAARIWFYISPKETWIIPR